MRRALVPLALAAAFVVAGPAPGASAHPLGNFTVNTATALVVRPDAVDVEVVVDFAEIPAVRVRQEADRDGDRAVSPAEAAADAARRCAALPAVTTLTADGVPVDLRPGTGTLAFPSGAAGLLTARLTCALSGTVDTAGTALAVASEAYGDRLGWREIVATGDGVALEGSSVPERSPSDLLTAYPDELLAAPLDVRTATLRAVPGAGNAIVNATGLRQAPGGDRLTRAFQGLTDREDLGLGFALLAALVAVGLGALHAFAPGHGKTLMAAYLVGRDGNVRHAAALAASVTVTHTIGVLVLGIGLSTASLVAPERLYPLLGLASGVLVLAVGTALLSRATGLRARLVHARHHRHDAPHEHHHDHDHEHEAAGEPGWHSHGGRGHRHDPPAAPTLRGIVTLGLAGGLVPSPSALVVLLGAVALGRAWFGVVLVTAYGIGMALALVGLGLLLVRSRGSLRRWAERRPANDRTSRGVGTLLRALPVATAVVVVTVGCTLTARAVTQL